MLKILIYRTVGQGIIVFTNESKDISDSFILKNWDIINEQSFCETIKKI